jgi:hypothetical protein
MMSNLEARGKTAFGVELGALLKSLRNDVAALATGDRTKFSNQAIALWSRILAIFRTGQLPDDLDAYEVLSTSGPAQLAVDGNARAAGLGLLAVGLSLLQHGRVASLWQLDMSASAALADGALRAKARWAGAAERPLFLVKGAGEAIALEKLGAFADDNAIVLHADDTWHRLNGPGTSARRVRGSPGRTGRVGTRHVSLGHLMDRCHEVDEFKLQFVAEVTL